MINRKFFIICFLTILAIVFRFYKLTWGSPYFFHPDERNIANAIIQLHFPNQLNPHFFAYGSFPAYIAYLFGIFVNILFSLYSKSPFDFLSLSLTSAIFSLRIISAFLSTALLFLIYKTGEKIGNKHMGFLSFLLAVFSPGFIQYAHFGTFEIWISFLSLALFLFCISSIKKTTIKTSVLMGFIFGLLLGTKISNLILVLLPLSCFIYSFFLNKNYKKYIFHIFLFACVMFITFLLTNPFVFLDSHSFMESIQYESKVAIGTLSVFYTGQFFNTIPLLFQLLYVYPFLINPILEGLFAISFLGVIKLSRNNIQLRFLLLTFFLIFLPQAFLFAKWTRYMVPTLPFVYLIMAIFLDHISHFLKQSYRYIIAGITLFSLVYSVAFFITAYVENDTRIEAALWAKQHIQSDVFMLTETYDLGILPFNPHFPHIALYNSYSLDSSSSEQERFQQLIQNTNYIILPSQRVMKNRLDNKATFPIGHTIYTQLFNERLGFKKIYQTPCDIWCTISYFGDPIFRTEETITVFDRPTVFIFKKI